MMGDTASAASGRMSTMRKLKHQFTSLKRAGLEPKEMVSKLAEAFSATQGELTDEVNFLGDLIESYIYSFPSIRV